MKTLSTDLVQQAIGGDYIECTDFHNGPCLMKFLAHFNCTLKTMYKMYIPIHVIPFLLFKRKKVLNSPRHEITKALKGYAKSVLFATTYTGILGVMLCTVKNAIKDLDGTKIIPISAFVSGISLLFQNDARRQQIALFLVPKVMESIYLLLKRRGLVSDIKFFQVILFALAMCILGYIYQNQPQNIKPNYRSVFNKVLGKI